MTLQDVLKAHPKPQPSTTATPPLLSPGSQSSSTNVMLMQGMQSVTQQNGVGGKGSLKVPQVLPAAATPTSQVQPAVATTAPLPIANTAPSYAPAPSANIVPNLDYQPGQAPRNLANAIAPAVPPAPPLASYNAPSTGYAPPPVASVAPYTPPASYAPQPSYGVAPPPPAIPPTPPLAPIAGSASSQVPAQLTPPPVDMSAAAPPVANSAPTPIAPISSDYVETAPAVSSESGIISTALPPVSQAPVAKATYTPPASVPSYVPPAPPTPAPVMAPVAARIQPSVPAPVYAAPVPETLPAPTYAPTTVYTPSVLPSAAIASSCVPRVKTWTKSCSDAGYPSGTPGKVTGETRTVCPDGSQQEVWVSNTCASADGGNLAPPTPVMQQVPAPTVSPAPAYMAPSGADVEPASTGEPMPLVQPTKRSSYTPVGEPEIAPTIVAPVSEDRVDGVCGDSSGVPTNSKPTYGLCNAGDVSGMTGIGPWRWSCKGVGGGITVSCAAPVAAAPVAEAPAYSAPPVVPVPNTPVVMPTQDGICGDATVLGADAAPVSGLCAKGAPSRVNGNGPWSWACSGFNGGQAAACTAYRKIDGVCGATDKTGSISAPTQRLCAAGIAGPVSGDGPWNWTCSGVYGGQAATCSAMAKRDAVCGSATTGGHRDAPTDSLCASGQPSPISGDGPWSWVCNGSNGGASAPCSAALSQNGACGAANGVALAKSPNKDLCAHGRPTSVTGAGPWFWSCAGTDGGDAESCTAPLLAFEPRAVTPPPAPDTSSAADQASPAPALQPSIAASAPAVPAAPAVDTGLCGNAADIMALSPPEKDLCTNAQPSDVTGNGPWTWTCSDIGGRKSNCSTLMPQGSLSDAIANKKSMPQVSAAPRAAVMAAAEAPAIPAAAPSLPPAPVMTPSVPTEAACGPASVQGTSSAPTSGLCETGKASAVRGNGPWHWTCAKGKTKASCEAQVQSDGICGVANGSVQRNAPSSGLCKSGQATQIEGSGPWLWSCVGIGGGSSSSCSATAQAQTRVDGVCGAAVNAAVASTPSSNLCDAGMPSSVYGNGPWTWTCSGLNSGVAASCSTQRVADSTPVAPGPAINGLCGAANGMPALVQPMDDLCATGTATGTAGDGPWNWNCVGSNGGMSVSCTAPLQPPAAITGSCGPANGMPTLTPPRGGLCSAGITSAVSGRGPWTWSCSGTDGGGAVSCIAPTADGSNGTLGSVVTVPDTSSIAPAPRSAPRGRVSSGGNLVTPQLPAGPLPPLNTGSMPSMMPPTGADSAFNNLPQPSSTPNSMLGNEAGIAPPTFAPDLPQGTTPLTPPPIRDTLPPSPALQTDSSGAVIPGNHFVLSSDMTTIAFIPGADNISSDTLPILDRLAKTLMNNSGVRITLTAYADTDTSHGVSPRDARRLSLTRALAVRDYLTSKGISSGRIDVRALGANVPSGEPDRVDIKAN